MREQEWQTLSAQTAHHYLTPPFQQKTSFDQTPSERRSLAYTLSADL